MAEDPAEIFHAASLVIDHFGSWPSLHDAEISRVEFDRASPSITVDIEAFGTTGKINAQGRLELSREAQIRFRFNDVTEVECSGLNNQNVIAAFSVWRVDGRIAVNVEPTYGLALQFVCEDAEVIAVQPRSH